MCLGERLERQIVAGTGRRALGPDPKSDGLALLGALGYKAIDRNFDGART